MLEQLIKLASLVGSQAGQGGRFLAQQVEALARLLNLDLLGGLLFGVATFRAGILPRWAAGLLAVTATLTPLAALLPHATQRLAAVPMGLALACLGYALWSERRAQAAEPVPARGISRLRQIGAE